MAKKYFEVEIEYTGTKIFHININDTMSEKEALAYIAENYFNLDANHNPVSEYGGVTVLAINYREEKQ